MFGILRPPLKNQGISSLPSPPKISLSLRSGGSLGASPIALPWGGDVPAGAQVAELRRAPVGLLVDGGGHRDRAEARAVRLGQRRRVDLRGGGWLGHGGERHDALLRVGALAAGRHREGEQAEE